MANFQHLRSKHMGIRKNFCNVGQAHKAPPPPHKEVEGKGRAFIIDPSPCGRPWFEVGSLLKHL